MNKIDEVFKRLKLKGKAAFIPFISIGDPDLELSFEIAKTLIDNGADIIELGFPFSDPMADGKVIQRSYARSLKNPVSMNDALGFIKRLKSYKNIPVIFFTYYNPVFVNMPNFPKMAGDAGVDAVLVVDLPPEESGELRPFIEKYNIYQIFLLAPTTDKARMEYVLPFAKGFVYYVSVTGVTGARGSLPTDISGRINEIKKIKDIPVGVGFGVSSGEQARQIKGCADAVIIGSKIIQFIEKNMGKKDKIIEEIAGFSSEIASCLN